MDLNIAHRTSCSIPDGISDRETEELDARIQTELDQLNQASTNVNHLENELDEARTKYRSIVSETSQHLTVIAHNKKKSIHKAREYYRTLNEKKIAHSEAVKAARQFQTATSFYKAAKETVALAESRLMQSVDDTIAQLNSAWQETLNHTILKVMEAEQEKARCEQDHKKRAAKYVELQAKIQVLDKKFAKSIKKSRPYFELKAEMDVKLMQQKQNVSDLQAAIHCTKLKYAESLHKLEKISEEIHQTRSSSFWCKVPRLPGVEADADSLASGLSDIDLTLLTSAYDDVESHKEDSDNDMFDTDPDMSCKSQSDCDNLQLTSKLKIQSIKSDKTTTIN